MRVLRFSAASTIDVAAAPAVAAVGAAELDELLAPEADGTGAAVAAPEVDLGLVEELHGGPKCKGRVRDPPLDIARMAGGRARQLAGSTDT